MDEIRQSKKQAALLLGCFCVFHAGGFVEHRMRGVGCTDDLFALGTDRWIK